MVKIGQIIRGIAALALTIGVILSILYVERKYNFLPCKQVEIQIQEHPGQSFITEKRILDLLDTTHKGPLLGTQLKKISSYNIKNQLESQLLVKNVLVFKTWHGVLKICLETKYVLARIITSKGAQLYVDENGDLIYMKGLPLLRLLVIDGIDPEKIAMQGGNLKSYDKGLLEVLHYLYKDPFFCYQITSLQVLDKHKIVLGTQIGNHKIELGKTENICEKFEKLRLFYNQVIPYKGWNSYHRINLEFENQLICE